ncbi:MAG: twin-arginine translocation signal domain-containing protein [Bacilli bacterium]
MNRREFIKNVARAGVAVGFPTIIPASALGKDGAVAPSERITGFNRPWDQGLPIQNFFSDKRVQMVLSAT